MSTASTNPSTPPSKPRSRPSVPSSPRENLDLLVSHFQGFFPHSEALLQFRQSCSFCLEPFGLSVDPILLGLDVLCCFLRAVELLLEFLEFFLQNSFASQDTLVVAHTSQRLLQYGNFFLSRRLRDIRIVVRDTRTVSAVRTTPPVPSTVLLAEPSDITSTSIPTSHTIHTNHIQQHCTMRTSDQRQTKGLDTESGVQQVLAKPLFLEPLSLSSSLSLSLSLHSQCHYHCHPHPLSLSLSYSLSLLLSLSHSLSFSLTHSLTHFSLFSSLFSLHFPLSTLPLSQQPRLQCHMWCMCCRVSFWCRVTLWSVGSCYPNPPYTKVTAYISCTTPAQAAWLDASPLSSS